MCIRRNMSVVKKELFFAMTITKDTCRQLFIPLSCLNSGARDFGNTAL